jgi:hypothetical protein
MAEGLDLIEIYTTFNQFIIVIKKYYAIVKI